MQDLRHVGPHEQIVCRRIVIADCLDEDSVPVRSPDNPVDAPGGEGPDPLIRVLEGTFDGFRLDKEGRIWASAGGDHCYRPDGTLLSKILVPETVSDVTFGGSRRNQLFITATTSLYTIHTGITVRERSVPARGSPIRHSVIERTCPDP